MIKKSFSLWSTCPLETAERNVSAPKTQFMIYIFFAPQKGM